MSEGVGRPVDSGEYYALLEEFTHLCEQLVGRGFSYLTVILCHELYRFLYPVEPYANVTHDDPVGFATNHIKKLIRLARECSHAVTPYIPNLRKFDDGDWQSRQLEMSTSNLYSELWREFDGHTLQEESLRLLKGRIPQTVIEDSVIGKTVLDMGCGSGRYSIALARVGAKQVIGVDVQSKSFAAAQDWCHQHGLPVELREGNVLFLPFAGESFDFVFCNGVIHHSASVEQGLRELSRVLKKSGRAFLYLYAAGGIFWRTREALRLVFRRIPMPYTQTVLHLIGMPSNRFIFCDTWYVPVETHTTTQELHEMCDRVGLSYMKVVGRNPFDLDGALEAETRGAREMWGEGEHRYILQKA